jgi:hypothetical protein
MGNPLEHMWNIYIAVQWHFPKINSEEICTQVDTQQKLEKWNNFNMTKNFFKQYVGSHRRTNWLMSYAQGKNNTPVIYFSQCAT